MIGRARSAVNLNRGGCGIGTHDTSFHVVHVHTMQAREENVDISRLRYFGRHHGYHKCHGHGRNEDTDTVKGHRVMAGKDDRGYFKSQSRGFTFLIAAAIISPSTRVHHGQLTCQYVVKCEKRGQTDMETLSLL